MSAVKQFQMLEGGLDQGTPEAEMLKTVQMRMGVRERKGPSILEQTKTNPLALEQALQAHALNKKIANRYNSKKKDALKRELERNMHPKVVAKMRYTVDQTREGMPIRVTDAHLQDPFNNEPILVHHPKDAWYANVTETEKQEFGEKYIQYTGEGARKVKDTQGFWVAITEKEYIDMLDFASDKKKQDANGKDLLSDRKMLMYLNKMAIEGNILKDVQAPYFDQMGQQKGYVRLVRGDILKRYREAKKDDLKLSDEEKELNSLKAFNDRLEKILMVVTSKRTKVVKKAENLTSGLDARTQEQLRRLTEAFNHPLKMGSLFKAKDKPWEIEVGEGKDKETKYFCDMLHKNHEKWNDIHGDVNNTSSAYQQFGDREKKTGEWHKALYVNGICVSPESLADPGNPNSKPYAQAMMPQTYHHLDQTNRITKKLNAKEDPSGLNPKSQTKEERVWGDAVFCARASDDESQCTNETREYPLTDEKKKGGDICEFTRMQRNVPMSMLNREKMPAKLERNVVVDAKIDLGARGISNNFYKATIKRVRKNGNLDLEFMGLSERQKKIMPGKCQPKYVDKYLDMEEASDLYHGSGGFYEEEQKYIRKKKGGKAKKMKDEDVESIMELFKKIELRQKQIDNKDSEPFDDPRDGQSYGGNIRNFHRV